MVSAAKIQTFFAFATTYFKEISTNFAEFVVSLTTVEDTYARKNPNTFGFSLT
jgi:hypothetical protein